MNDLKTINNIRENSEAKGDLVTLEDLEQISDRVRGGFVIAANAMKMKPKDFKNYVFEGNLTNTVFFENLIEYCKNKKLLSND